MKSKPTLVLRGCRLLGLAAAASLAAVGSASGQSYHVQKSSNYLQTGPGAPVPNGPRAFEFYAEFPGSLSSPVLTAPTGQTVPLFKGDEGYETSFRGLHLSTKAGFDAAYPSGNYTLTSTGNAPVVMNLGADLYPTTVPQITNGTWNAGGLLVLNPTQANTITINTFADYATAGVGGYSAISAGGDTSDAEASAITSSIRTAAGTTTVSATPVTSLVIPARTFTSGRVYAIDIEFFTAQTFATSAVAPNGVFTGYSNSTRVYVAALAPGTNTVAAPVIARQPVDVTARAGTNASFVISVTFNGSTTFPPNGTFFSDWFFNGSVLDTSGGKYLQSAIAPGFGLTINNVTAADAGEYSYRIVSTGGLATTNVVRLTVLSAPVITTQPQAQGAVAGGAATFSVAASGEGNTYQWRKDGTAIAGATSSTLTLSNVTAASAGSYTVVITNSAGSATSSAATLTLVPASAVGRLINLSILTAVGTGGDSFTMGYVVGGAGTSGAKPLIIRAAGPSLSALGVTGVLDDPKLELFAGSTKAGENDNWGGGAELTGAMASVGAFAFSGPASRDAAALASITSSDNSVRVSATGNGSGAVIAELYDATPAASYSPATPRLINVSVLKNVGAGLTAGFVIGGSTSRTVLVRAIGPALGAAPFNVPGVIADPQLALFSGQNKISENNDWGGGAALSAAFTQVGAFALPAASKDAALLATLAPGNYTVQVSSAGTASGIALVEVYEVP